MRSQIRGACAGLALLTAAGVVAQEAITKPQLTVTIQTTKFAIPGLDKLPPEALKALGGSAGAQRSLMATLVSPGNAPASATADLDIPAGLKLGSTLNLEIPRDAENNPGALGFEGNKQFESWEFHRYWGCSTTVKPGQPKVMKGSQISSEALARAAEAARKAGLKGPETSYAFWPNSKVKPNQLRIDPAAAAPGKYNLRTNYVGSVAFDVPGNVSFMEPIELNVDGQDLGNSIKLSWKAVPNTVGYYAMAMASKGNNTHVMWISSEVPNGFDQGWGTTAETKALVEKGVYMPASKLECSIPAGIFKGCRGVSVRIVAHGPSFTQMGSRPSVRVLTESSAMTTLGFQLPGGDN